MNEEPYGTEDERPISFKGVYSHCPDNNPVSCPNKDLCVDDLMKCQIEELSCVNKTTPILCNVDGFKTCVNSRFKCDCPSGQVKCETDGKCVLSENKTALCASIFTGKCPQH
jgi:hypothetical protein